MSRNLLPRRRLLLGALLVGITCAVFQATLQAHFVAWDDGIHVFRNPYLHPVTLAHVLHFWAHPYKNLYIPVAYAAFALLALAARLPAPITDPQVGPLDFNPVIFHAASLLVHSLNAVLVFALLRRLVKRDWPAFAGALLFAVHPMQVEAVAWVSELRGLLSGLFSLLALLLFLGTGGEKDGGGRRLAFATLCFALALLCKPSAAAMPLMAWTLNFWALGRPWRERAPLLVGWLTAAAALAWVTRSVQPTGEVGAVPLWARPFVAGDALAFYLGKLAWPAQLGIDYGRTPAFVLSHGWGYAAWLVPVMLGGCLAWQHRRFPVLTASGAVFSAALLPVLGFVPFIFQRYSTVADRYLYLAMLGPSLALAWGLTRCRSPLQIRMGWGACALALGLLGRQSAAQVTFWHDSMTLFTRAIAVNPQSWVSFNNRGYALAGEGQLAEAVFDYQHSLAINPLYFVARVNLGAALAREGHWSDAIAQYEQVLRRAPDDADAHNNLGNALAATGKTADAIAEYQRALRLSPGMALAHNNLGLAYQKQGQQDAAMAEYREAARLAPDFAGTHSNLGAALDQQGRTAEAASEYAQAARLAPGDANARNNLGVDLEMLGRPQDALAQFREAVRLRPNFVGARRNLEMALKQSGRGP